MWEEVKICEPLKSGWIPDDGQLLQISARRFRDINRDPAKTEGWHRLIFPEYCLERFPRGTTCRPHRQTASKPQDAVITPESRKVKAVAWGWEGGGDKKVKGGREESERGRRWAKRKEKKIQVETKRRNHIKKHLKENGRRRDAERRQGEAGFREDEDEKEERRRRRKSCGHGCTERDSGCTSTCPFSTELRRVRDLWKQRAGGAGNTRRAASLPCFTTSDSVER